MNDYNERLVAAKVELERIAFELEKLRDTKKAAYNDLHNSEDWKKCQRVKRALRDGSKLFEERRQRLLGACDILGVNAAEIGVPFGQGQGQAEQTTRRARVHEVKVG